MKSFNEMSKDELHSLITNNMPKAFTDRNEVQFECASCGESKDMDYYFICDKCNKLIEGTE